MKRFWTKPAPLSISAPAAYVLHIGLPVVILQLGAIALMLAREVRTDALLAYHRYLPMLEHAAMGLTILVIGAFLFDYIARREKSQ